MSNLNEVSGKRGLASRSIRAHAISPGRSPRAASGIHRFDGMLDRAAATVPEQELVGTGDMGVPAAFLASDAARRITSTVIPVDSGQHLLA